MQIACTPYVRTEHKGQDALWVTNGCTSMSKPNTTKTTPMGVDNNVKKKPKNIQMSLECNQKSSQSVTVSQLQSATVSKKKNLYNINVTGMQPEI